MDNIRRMDLVAIELENGTMFRSFANKQIGEGDQGGNIFGGLLTRNGEPVNLSGATVTGYFIRADESCVVINGLASGNRFTVTLPRECYAIEGNFSLAIKVTGGNVSGTMRIVDGTVVNTSTGIAIDPGSIVPSLAELMAVIGRAEAAAEDIAELQIYAQKIENNDYKIVVNRTT